MTRRAGFSLIELIVAIVLLLVVALSIVGASRVVSASIQRASLELRAAQLIQEETQRLRTLPVDSLADGSAVRPGGTTLWTVGDSGSYLRVDVSVTTAPLSGVSVSDTVFVYRVR